MRAGLLTETISLYKAKSFINETGEKCKIWVKLKDIRARKRSLKVIAGGGINANEEFIGDTIVFQVRAYPFIDENLRFSYKDKTYKIILMDRQSDNSFIITGSKKNL